MSPRRSQRTLRKNYYFGCHGDNPDFIDPHTRQRIKKEFILDSGQRAQQLAIEIIESHKPEAISPSAVEDLAEVTNRWHKG